MHFTVRLLATLGSLGLIVVISAIISSSSSSRAPLPTTFQLVDLHNISFTLHSPLCGEQPVPLLTLVSSAVTNQVGPTPELPPTQESRAAIRSSWGRPAIPGAVLLFLLGTPAPSHRAAQQQQQVQLQALPCLQLVEEHRRHGDILQGSFVDTYRNLTYKNIMGKLWASSACTQVS